MLFVYGLFNRGSNGGFLTSVTVYVLTSLFFVHHIMFKNRSALAVDCCILIHCLEVSCKEDQITSA